MQTPQLRIGQTLYHKDTDEAWTVAVFEKHGRVQLRRNGCKRYYNHQEFYGMREYNRRRAFSISLEGRAKMCEAQQKRSREHYREKFGRHAEKVLKLAVEYNLTPEQVWDSVHDLPEYQT